MTVILARPGHGKFQFLGRNSGRSDSWAAGRVVVVDSLVSIPRSEFWSFGRCATLARAVAPPRVSIPRSEFWSFGRYFLFALRAVSPGVSIPRSEFWSFGPCNEFRSGVKC